LASPIGTVQLERVARAARIATVVATRWRM
jgi:hypothetical protein